VQSSASPKIVSIITELKYASIRVANNFGHTVKREF